MCHVTRLIDTSTGSMKVIQGYIYSVVCYCNIVAVGTYYRLYRVCEKNKTVNLLCTRTSVRFRCLFRHYHFISPINACA